MAAPDPRESSDAVVQSFLLHPLPARITKQAFSWRATGWLGTVCLGLLLVLTGTGGVLMFLYVPSVERAYASIQDLEAVVPFGRWIRATHRAAAHLMVLAVMLHLVRVFLAGAYKKEGAPGASRPLNWCVGLGLLGTTLGLSFTGYLLPWDQLAYWAVTVGTRIAGSVPVVGEDLRRLMVGGAVVGEPTLVRFYALHVFVLPALTALLVSYHLWRIRKDGGLAISDRVVDRVRAKAVAAPPRPARPTRSSARRAAARCRPSRPRRSSTPSPSRRSRTAYGARGRSSSPRSRPRACSGSSWPRPSSRPPTRP